mmetsp:Transcript_32356/g.70905  ORF Transcript_32356/g.70905 Transcript_32356/m.70905 type:complete len:248 (+) Transcript_32356:843-1586(+)
MRGCCPPSWRRPPRPCRSSACIRPRHFRHASRCSSTCTWKRRRRRERRGNTRPSRRSTRGASHPLGTSSRSARSAAARRRRRLRRAAAIPSPCPRAAPSTGAAPLAGAAAVRVAQAARRATLAATRWSTSSRRSRAWASSSPCARRRWACSATTPPQPSLGSPTIRRSRSRFVSCAALRAGKRRRSWRTPSAPFLCVRAKRRSSATGTTSTPAPCGSSTMVRASRPRWRPRWRPRPRPTWRLASRWR